MYNKTMTITFSTYYRTTLIIFGALLIGLLLFFGVSMFLYLTGDVTPDPLLGRTFLIILIPLTLMSIGVSVVIPRRVLSTIKHESSIGDKLTSYRVAMIIKFALYEGVGLFALVAFMVSWELYFLFVLAVVVLIFLLNIPTLDRIADTLNLTHEERMILGQNEPFEMEYVEY